MASKKRSPVNKKGRATIRRATTQKTTNRNYWLGFWLIIIGIVVASSITLIIISGHKFYAGEPESMKMTITKLQHPTIIARDINLDLGLAELVLEDDESTDHIKVAANYYEKYGEPILTSDEEDGFLDIDFSQKHQVRFSDVGTPGYSLILGEGHVPTNLNIKLGAGQGEIKLNKTALKDISAELGAGTLDFSFGQGMDFAGAFDLNIGAGALTLNFPSEIGYRIKYDLGAGQIVAENNTVAGIGQTGSLESSNYRDTNNKIEIEVSIGTGRLVVNN